MSDAPHSTAAPTRTQPGGAHGPARGDTRHVDTSNPTHSNTPSPTPSNTSRLTTSKTSSPALKATPSPAPSNTHSPTPSNTPKATRRAPTRGIRTARLLLGAYAVALALIAFWPVPVDRGAGPLLRAITRAVPWLTYDVIEFSANIVLFVPLGALLALVVRRRRMLVLPVALAATVLIESAQAVLLANRTASVRDIVANFLGAALGLLIVHLLDRH